MWFRVFGTNDVQPEPAAILAHLRGQGVEAQANFGGDAHGWFKADFSYAPTAAPLHLERYLASEDNIRDDLNAWAAWLETVDENQYVPRLMQGMIDTQQLFTMHCPRDAADEIVVQKLCIGLCQFLADQTKGVYQVDTQGFFAPDGRPLVREQAEE
ncbi:MAG: hypothetical protein K2R98_23915 [Gemmataceae bacterium]|nr:hypothetical protein [Gemmataceae bacterium]